MLFKVYRTTVAIVLALGTVWAVWFFYGKIAGDSVATPTPSARIEARSAPSEPVMPYAAMTVADWKKLAIDRRIDIAGDWVLAYVANGVVKNKTKPELVGLTFVLEKCIGGSSSKMDEKSAADIAGACLVAAQMQ